MAAFVARFFCRHGCSAAGFGGTTGAAVSLIDTAGMAPKPDPRRLLLLHFSVRPGADTSPPAVSAPHSAARPPPNGRCTPRSAAPGVDSRSHGSNACPHPSGAPRPPPCWHSRPSHCRSASPEPESSDTASALRAFPDRPSFRPLSLRWAVRRRSCASAQAHQWRPAL
jgi:hypothetical protein